MSRRVVWASVATVGIGLATGGGLFFREAFRRAENPYQRALDQKIAEAELTLAYEITSTRSVTFHLFPTDSEVKIISHLNVPPDNPHDNTREYLYGLRVEVLNVRREVIWSNVYWEKSVATKIQPPGALVPWEPAFYRDREDLMPTDNRMTTVFLTPFFLAATDKKTTPKYLRISLADSNYPSGVCRAFRKVARSPEDRPTAWRTVGRKTRDAVTAHSVYSEDMLTDKEREALVAFKWERLFAEGRKDRDYFLRPLYLARTEPPPAEEDPYGGVTRFLVSDRRFVAVNVRGVGTIRVEVTFPEELGISSRRGLRLEVERLDEDGGMGWQTKWVEVRSSLGLCYVTVPPGLHTFLFRSDGPAAIRIYVDDPRMCVEGAQRSNLLAVSGRWVELEPHTFGATYYLSVGPGDIPILADVGYNARFGGAVRIATRLRLEGKDVSPQRYEVFYDLLDAQGNQVRVGHYEATALPAPFEYYEAEVLNPDVVPSAPDFYQVPIPPNARTLRVRTSRVAEVAFYAQDVLRERVYRVPTKEERSRDVIFFDCENPPDKEWRYFRPENCDDLNRQSRAVGVRWFCRALRRKSDERRSVRLYDVDPLVRVLRPETRVEGVELFERFSEASDAADDMTFFEVEGGVSFRTRFVDLENPHHRLPVGFEVVRDRPFERPPRLWLDGEVFLPVVVPQNRGRYLLDEIPQGIRTVRFEDDSGARLLVNRDPGPGAKSFWKRRLAYRMTKPVFVTVSKRGYASQTLNVIVYAKDASARRLTVQIANPPPLLPGPEFAWQKRTYQLDVWESCDVFDPQTGERYTHRVTVFIPFSEAFPPREYFLRLSLTGEGLGRFFVVEDEPFVVTPTRDAVLNLIGPGNLWVRWDGALRGSRLRSVRWNVFGESVVERVPFIAGTIFPEAHLSVPSGLHTYLLNVEGVEEAGLFFYVDRPDEMRLGRTPLLTASRRTGLRSRVVPETSVGRFYVTRQETVLPLEFEVPEGVVSFRVEVRRLDAVSISEGKVFYEVVDAENRRLSVGTISVEVPSPVRTEFGEGLSRSISGVGYGYVRVPFGGKRLFVVADDPKTLLALSAQRSDFLWDAYLPEDSVSTTVRVGDSAHTRQWFPLTPENHDVFFFERRWVDVVIQKVAVEPEEILPSTPVRFWKAFVPRGIPKPDLEVMEPLDPKTEDEQTLLVADVWATHWYEIPLNEGVEWNLRNLPGFRMETRDVPISYVCRVPVRLSVWREGIFHAAFDLSPPSGTVTLRGMPVGSGKVECRVEPEGCRLFAWLNEGEISSSTAWSKRGYCRLEPKGSMTVEMEKPSAAPYSVNVVGYVVGGTRESRIPLRVRVEPERLATSSDRLTLTERVYYLFSQGISQGVPLARDVSTLGEPFRFVVALQGDVGVGKVRLVLTWEAEGVGYFRFFGSDEENVFYEPGEVAVLNVVGPGSLRIVSSEGVGGDRLRATLLTPDGVAFASDLALSASETEVSLPLPASGVTVRVENLATHRMGLRFFVGEAEVRPRYQRQSYYISYPASPVTVTLPSSFRDEQTLRVTVRKSLSGLPETIRLRYRLLDAEGKELRSGSYSLVLVPSGEGEISKAAWLYIEATSEVAQVELLADEEVFYRLHRRLSGVVREVILPDKGAEDVRIRLPVTGSTEWEPVEPMEEVLWARRGRTRDVWEPVALISATREWGSLVGSFSGGVAVAEVLEPLRSDDVLFVMEPVLPQGEKEIVLGPATFFRIRPNRNVMLSVGEPEAPSLPVDVRLFYRLPTIEGQRWPCSLRVFLDESEVVELPLVVSQGFVTIPDVVPGFHRLRASSSCEGIELYVNQTPSSEAIPWKLRTVHTIAFDEPVTLLVEKREREVVNLNVVVYPEPEASEVTLWATIDEGIRQGHVEEVSEDFTPFRRRYHLPVALSTAFYLNRQEETPGMPQTFLIPLQNDLVPGVHRVKLGIESGARRVRARFFILRRGEISDQVEFHQSESEDLRG